MPGLHPQAGTAGVERAAEHERAAHAPVAGRHDQQVGGAAASAVPVLGQRGQVDVVGHRTRRSRPFDPGRTGDPGPHDLFSEDVPDADAGRPPEVQRADRGALRLGHGGRHRQAGPDACPARGPQQPRARPGDGRQRTLRIVGQGQGTIGGGHDPPAEPDERDLEAVGVDLSGQRHRAVRVDGEPVRGTAQHAAPGRGVHLDQPQRLQLGGHRARGGAGDAEPRAQRRARGRPPAVD